MIASVKIPRLPETDLACIAPLSRDQKYRALRARKAAYPPYYYNAVRACVLDLLNVAPGPLVTLPRTPLETIENEVMRLCRHSDDEVKANLCVARGCYNYSVEHGLTGMRYDVLPLQMGLSEKMIYWWPAVIAIDGRLVVVYIDPRRQKKLTREGRRFVFSAQYERFRAMDDFSGVVFAVFQFANSPSGPRRLIPHFSDGVELWSYDQLNEMVIETYEIWREVLAERADDDRRGTGTGPFFLTP
jgi:hypothetical protein